MLTYDLDRRGKLARYDYLYRCIREDILAGRLTCLLYTSPSPRDS